MDLVERLDSDGVCTLALNRPERRNALSADLIEALLARFDEVDRDETVRVVVLTGRGKSFCAGGDLAGGMGGGDGVLAAHRGRGRFAELLSRIPRVRVPVIGALNGDALGGGLGVAAACDLVVADREARLGTPEVGVGLFPHVILAILQRNLPRKPLMELVLTGGKWTADEAKALGLINRVAEPGQALVDAQALGAELATKSPATLALGKAAFHRIADLPYDDALAYMHTQLTLNLLTEDAMEGVAAFLQKRPPVWKGR